MTDKYLYNLKKLNKFLNEHKVKRSFHMNARLICNEWKDCGKNIKLINCYPWTRLKHTEDKKKICETIRSLREGDLSKIIDKCFLWRTTKQGQNFWHQLNQMFITCSKLEPYNDERNI